MRAKNDGAGTGIEQRRETLGEFELLLLTKKVEERGSVDDREMPTQFGQSVDRCDGRWGGWYRSGGTKMCVIKRIPGEELSGVRFLSGSEQLVTQRPESCYETRVLVNLISVDDEMMPYLLRGRSR